MKSNYSRFQDLPVFKIELFSNTYKVGDVIYNNIYDLLSNLDLLFKTQHHLQNQYDLMNKSMNNEKDYNIKNQYKKNVSVLEKSLLKNKNNINLFQNELVIIDKNELVDLIDELSKQSNPTNQTIRIIKFLEKGIFTPLH